jgi:uncharacterized membrane protein YraQ (UPF0718 family)
MLCVALCAWLRGVDGIRRALLNAFDSILLVAPQILAGLLLAGLVQVLVPKDAVSRWLGNESGMRGLFIAEAAGVLTPGGPYGSFALVYALGKVGADIGVLIAYLTAWATLGVMRLVVWEIPFLGPHISLLRWLICLPMPIVAGLIARRLALRWGWNSTAAIVK